MGAFRTAAVSVATAATKLTTFGDDARADFDLLIYNNGSVTVYLGSSTVTTAAGIPLAPGATYSTRAEADVYGIVAAGTCECRVASMGVG